MELSSFDMPSTLPCSFPVALHPQYESIRAQCDPWILSIARPSSNAARTFIVDCLFPYFCCVSCPMADTTRVVLATKLVSWLFISDTDDDDPNALGSDDSASERRHETILAILAAGCMNDSVSTGDAALDAFSEVWQGICKDMCPGLQLRFVQAMKGYFNAVKLQARYRRLRSVPDVEQYKEICRPASFALPAFILMEYSHHIELDEETLHSPDIVRLQEAVIDHICWCNDVISCKLEISIGDYFNLPSVLCAAEACTFPEAIRRVVSDIEKVDKLCVELVDAITSGNLIENPGVRSYVSGLCSSMSGNLVWSYKTARYKKSCTRDRIVSGQLPRARLGYHVGGLPMRQAAFVPVAWCYQTMPGTKRLAFRPTSLFRGEELKQQSKGHKHSTSLGSFHKNRTSWVETPVRPATNASKYGLGLTPSSSLVSIRTIAI